MKNNENGTIITIKINRSLLLVQIFTSIEYRCLFFAGKTESLVVIMWKNSSVHIYQTPLPLEGHDIRSVFK